MGLEIVCPICNLEHIPHNREKCPQCDADLTCFKVLDTLVEAVGETAEPLTSPSKLPIRRKRVFLACFFGVLAVLGVALLGFGLYRIRMIESRLGLQRMAFKHAVDTVVSRSELILAKQDRMASLVMEQLESQRKLLMEQPPPEIRIEAQPSLDAKKVDLSSTEPFAGHFLGGSEITTPTQSSEAANNAFDFYQATDTDTLWEIAERFYGAGHFYPVLLEYNPELSIYNVSRKDRIAILKDTREAKRIYRAITLREENRLFWVYTVRAGDTPSVIKTRYCSGKACLPSEYDSNPNAQIHPGTKVKIQLAGVLK